MVRSSAADRPSSGTRALGVLGAAALLCVTLTTTADAASHPKPKLTQRLTTDNFAVAMSEDGDVLVVGDVEADEVRVYERKGQQFHETAVIPSPESPSERATRESRDATVWFGASVAISGDRLLVGAPFGCFAYVFERKGAQWVPTARLEGNRTRDPERRDNFGAAVDLVEDVAVVSATNESPGPDTDRIGAVYAFELNGGPQSRPDPTPLGTGVGVVNFVSGSVEPHRAATQTTLDGVADQVDDELREHGIPPIARVATNPLNREPYAFQDPYCPGRHPEAPELDSGWSLVAKFYAPGGQERTAGTTSTVGQESTGYVPCFRQRRLTTDVAGCAIPGTQENAQYELSPEVRNHYGSRVALEGDLALITAPWEGDAVDEEGYEIERGVVYVHERRADGSFTGATEVPGVTHSQGVGYPGSNKLDFAADEHRIVVSRLATDYSGIRSRDTVAIYHRAPLAQDDDDGDLEDDSDSVDVASTWERVGVLEWPNEELHYILAFGRSPQIQGDHLFVGSRLAGPEVSSGAVHVFDVSNPTTMTEVTRIQPDCGKDWGYDRCDFSSSTALGHRWLAVGTIFGFYIYKQ